MGYSDVVGVAMSEEVLTIIGVGIALAVFNWRFMVRLENRLDGRIDRLDGRIDRLDHDFKGLAREFSELRGEIRGRWTRDDG